MREHEDKRHEWVFWGSTVYAALVLLALIIDRGGALGSSVGLLPFVGAGLMQATMMTLFLQKTPAGKYQVIVGLAGCVGFLFILATFVAGTLFDENLVVRVTNMTAAVYILTGMAMSYGSENYRVHMAVVVGSFFVLCVLSSFIAGFLGQVLS